MLLSIVVGYVVPKYVEDKNRARMIAVVFGFVIGLFGHFGLVYPLYMAVDPDVVTYPEVLPLAVYMFLPQFKIFDFRVYVGQTVPIIVTLMFMGASLVGVLIGYWLWRHVKPPIYVRGN